MSRLAMLMWSGGTLLVIIALMLFFLQVIDVTRTIPPGFTRGDQCETLNVTGTILEPENTWSNVGYIFAGLCVFYRSRRIISATVGILLSLTGVFSALYHAVPTNGTLQTFDIAAVNWVLLALVGYAILSLDLHFYGNARDVKFEKMIALISFVLGTVMAITRTKVSPFESTTAAVSLIAVLVVLLLWGYFSGKDPKTDLSRYEKITYLTVVIILALPTALFRMLDGLEDGVKKALCNPDGIFQAHALWHLFSALLLLICFDYFTRVANQPDERIFADADPD
jgi:hypothetical protein